MADRPTIGDLLDVLHREVDGAVSARVDEIGNALAARADEVRADVGRSALECLRHARRFPAMQSLASAMIQAGTADLTVRFLHVLAILSQGDITAAVALLNDIGKRGQPGGTDLVAMLNLTGQTYKRAALATPNDARTGPLLAQAIRNYHKATEVAQIVADDHAWLTNRSNVVALLARAARKGLAIRGVRAGQVSELATEILNRVQDLRARGTALAPDYAVAIEACVALGDYDEAARWAERLADAGPRLGFEIDATLRQLLEVWELREDSAGGRLVLPLLRAALLSREGGHVMLRGEAIASTLQAQLEKVFGDDEYKSLTWFLKGLHRCRAIARVENQSGRARGSGILVWGSKLHPKLGDRWLLMTNAHVLCRRDAPQSGALWPEEARVAFHGQVGEDRGSFQVREVVWTSEIRKLDTTLAALDRTPRDVPDYPISEKPLILDPPGRIYAIGHPLGGDLALSLDDNRLLGFLAPRIHYRTPTDQGSSGSPLFDDQWNLIGLHHAGREDMRRLDGQGFYQANEGIWIKSILDAVRKGLQEPGETYT